MLSRPPHGLAALILLHEIVLIVLGVFGVLSALYDAMLKNDVRLQTGLYLLFGSAALLLGWSYVVLIRRHPLRNRQALLGILVVSAVSATILAASLPVIFYRLQSTPPAAWVCLVPTLVLIWLATRHLKQLNRSHVGVSEPEAPDHHPLGPTERSAPPASPPSTNP